MRMNYRTTLGRQGLPYGSKVAEQMISERMDKRGIDRREAVGQLAAEGNLKTEGEAITRSGSLAEARRERSTEDRRARDWLARAKEEAAERGVSLSEIMNEKALKGEVKL
jgi:hypothetical protein